MKKILTPIITLISSFLFATPVWAANIIDQMKKIIDGSGIELEAGKPEQPELVVSKIISYLLGFLGVVFFILIIYAGILWMTASGAEEKITKARKIITSAAIGLAIVLGAYLITYLVVYVLQNATRQP